MSSDKSGETRKFSPAKIEEGIFTGKVVIGGINDVRTTASNKKVVNIGGYSQMSEDDIDNGTSAHVSLVWWQNLATLHHTQRKPGDCVWIKGKYEQRTYTDKDGVERKDNQIQVQAFKLLSTTESRAARNAA
ncbi:MAG: single-stranded DNA-binding protein [Acidobacteria bacterium]|nr:single-stranded DNA-binding protein [Acidobacteriota bacterium]